MTKIPFKLFKYCDLFGQAVRFNRKGADQYTSIFGGITSIIIVLCVLLISKVDIFLNEQSQISQFTSKDRVTVVLENTYTDQKDPVYLDHTGFMFAVGIDQTNQGLTYTPYFQITAEIQSQVNRGKNVTPGKLLVMNPCTESSFENLGYSIHDLNDVYQNRNLNSFLCPTNTTKSELSIFGNYLKSNFSYLKISVNKCVNDSSLKKIDENLFDYYNSTESPPCAPQSEIDNYFKDNQWFSISLYTTNTVINPQKPKDYTTNYLADDLTFFFQPGIQYKQVDVFYSKYDVETDEGIYIYPDIHSKTYLTRQPNQYQEQTSTITNNTVSSSYIDIYFRRANMDTKVTRTFVKIDELISFLGGFLSSFIVVFQFIVGKYNFFRLKLKLVNNIYDCRVSEKPMDQQNNIQNYKNKIISDVEPSPKKGPINLNQPLDNEQVKLLGLKSKNDFLHYFFENFIMTTKKLKLSFKYLIYLLTFKYKLRIKENLMIDYALEKIDGDFDIKKLMDHYLEFDKLKEVLLERDQIVLLDFIPKPNIYPGKLTEAKQIFGKKTSNEEKFDIFLSVVKSFDKIMNSYHRRDIDHKSLNLISQLGQDIRRIFLITSTLYKQSEIKGHFCKQISRLNTRDIITGRLHQEIIQAHKICTKLSFEKHKSDSSGDLEMIQYQIKVGDSLQGGIDPEDQITNELKLGDMGVKYQMQKYSYSQGPTFTDKIQLIERQQSFQSKLNEKQVSPILINDNRQNNQQILQQFQKNDQYLQPLNQNTNNKSLYDIQSQQSEYPVQINDESQHVEDN